MIEDLLEKLKKDAVFLDSCWDRSGESGQEEAGGSQWGNIRDGGTWYTPRWTGWDV